MKKTFCLFIIAFYSLQPAVSQKQPVDYVNPYMGNISHLLVPTFPTVHLPNSMMRMYPNRADFTSDLMSLPLALTTHRGAFAFSISPVQEDVKTPVLQYSYDNEKVKPYRYSVFLDEAKIGVDFAPSHQAALYAFNFIKTGDSKLVISSHKGWLRATPKSISGMQVVENGPARMFFYMEWLQPSTAIGALRNGREEPAINQVEGNEQAMVIHFGNAPQVQVRYGISFISEAQAKKNLEREISTYDLNSVAAKGQTTWNNTLSKLLVRGGADNDKAVFYTSLYRTYERCVNISEDGKYYSGFDNAVHEDEGKTAYVDDWIWDTYRAVHPLRILIEPTMESHIVQSFIRYAQQSKEGWLPMFPLINGDGHAMNGNHGVAVMADAYIKGLRGFDVEAGYQAARATLTQKSLIPWTRTGLTAIDSFYQQQGYFPALQEGEKETVKAVGWENRQPVPVTLGKSYDDWALAQLAKALNKTADWEQFLQASLNYRKLFNDSTAFFHPKDAKGNFIQPFDYTFSGGIGARKYYDENNGWTFRWDVQHNVTDLVALHGGPAKFVANLDATFREPLGKSKYEFYAQLPDHTGNVGQFSMANEPSLHIPYLYNYAGAPWKTQKRVRQLLKYFFRNDPEGVPGDEDGGGTSAFVVFSALGFYPVTPGSTEYAIGSPLFNLATIQLGNGKSFIIEAKNASGDNKYIQSATLNGKPYHQYFLQHADIIQGGKLVLVMGNKAKMTL